MILMLGASSISRTGATPSAPTFPVVATAEGQLRGQILGEVVSFKGVPFAAPPVGPLRWHEPTPVQPWSGVRDASAFAPPCAQAALGWNDNVAAQSREDCLYLNVWAPVRHNGAALPVMVFFPGGAYHGGSARGLSAIEPSYDGAKLAQRGVIVITANYRLGLFGFLAHPELTAESPHHASGNYALMDNIAALNWVKANIGRFGGDPNNVTAFGQSAGSFSVGFLMTSPLAKGLFAKAISMSGTVLDQRVGQPELKDAEAAGAKFARGLGAPATGGIAALRGKSAQDLFRLMTADQSLHDAEPQGPGGGRLCVPRAARAGIPGRARGRDPTDGRQHRARRRFRQHGGSRNAQGRGDACRPRHGRSPVRIGSLHWGREGAKAIQSYYARYGDLAGQAAKVYGGASATAPADGDVLTAFDTDIYFRCGANMIAGWHARVAPTWRYEFSHGYEPLGAVHLWDMLYVFGWLQPPADQPGDARLRDQMQQYLAAFARTGNPNAPGLPIWPKSGADGAYMDFASQGAVSRPGLRPAACDVFARKTGRTSTALSARLEPSIRGAAAIAAPSRNCHSAIVCRPSVRASIARITAAMSDWP